MMKPRFKRTRLLVDPSFQFGLLRRTAFYLLLWTIVIFHVFFIFHLYEATTEPAPYRGMASVYAEFFSQQKPLLGTLILVTPLLLYDLLKFSNRIAGPLFRCRRVMQEMAAGNAVPEFKPRKHDFMAKFFEDFNALIKEWNVQVTTRRNGSPGARNAEDSRAEERAVSGSIRSEPGPPITP
jgi:hypothetical protein